MIGVSSQEPGKHVYRKREVTISLGATPASPAGECAPEQLFPGRRILALHQVVDAAGSSKQVPRAQVFDFDFGAVGDPLSRKIEVEAECFGQRRCLNKREDAALEFGIARSF